MTTVSVIDATVRRLRAAGCIAAPEEAAELLTVAGDDPARLEDLVGRREGGTPLPWLVGSVEFCGRRYRLGEGVFVPRPRSEELAARAARLTPAGGLVVDLCAGVGVIAGHVAAEVPSATVVAVELDPSAASWAAANGIPTVIGDLAGALRSGVVDVVTAVAPYVPTREIRFLPADVQDFEPRLALDGGDDGLHLVRQVVATAGRLLRPGGWLLTEIGGEQDALLADDLAAAGFDRIEPWYDDEDDELTGIAARRQGATDTTGD